MSSSFSVFLSFSNDIFRHFPIFYCKTYTKNTTFGKILSKKRLSSMPFFAHTVFLFVAFTTQFANAFDPFDRPYKEENLCLLKNTGFLFYDPNYSSEISRASSAA